MFNLLKSDLYRMVRRIDFWVYAGVAAVLMILVACMLSFFASPEFANMVTESVDRGVQSLTEEQRTELTQDLDESLKEIEALRAKVMPSLTSTWSQAFLSGGLLGILGSVFIAVFLSRDFKSGFVKNLVMDRRGRWAYYGEKLVFVALVQAIFLAVCAAFSTLGFALFGFTYEVSESVADVALWLALSWLVSCAYTFLTACVVWLTQQEWLSVLWAVLISSGMIGAFLVQVALMLSRAIPVFAAAAEWTLAGSVASIGKGAAYLLTPNSELWLPGMLPVVQVLIVCGLMLVAGIAVTFAACRRRDIR